jgi:hypothetical protein
MLIEKWQAYRENLVPYRINADGALAEWVPEKYRDNYAHRHNSHLYPVFPGMEFLQADADAALLKAAGVALDKRFAFDTTSAHGLIHVALMATRLHDVEKVRTSLDRFSRRQYIYPSFMTSHEPGQEIYNLDSILSLPRLLMEMLVFSRPGHIELLPAWPGEFADGSIQGVLVRGGHRIDIAWEHGKLKSATLYAGSKDNVTITYGDRTRSLACRPGAVYRFDSQLNSEEL